MRHAKILFVAYSYVYRVNVRTWLPANAALTNDLERVAFKMLDFIPVGDPPAGRHFSEVLVDRLMMQRKPAAVIAESLGPGDATGSHRRIANVAWWAEKLTDAHVELPTMLCGGIEMVDLTCRLRRLVDARQPEADTELLNRFVANQDGMAFAAIVSRHGPMVLAVCRRVLRHRQDAEDAFQATFLVLARRAGAIRPRSLLGNWLYGVSYRTALAARRVAAARRAREAKAAAERTEEVSPPEGIAPELREALDRELAALPSTYRAALVACDLEGLSRRDAAGRLGWTEGTLSSRLARGRVLLARRLGRFGLAVPVAGLIAVAAPTTTASELVGQTVRLATLVAAGEAAIAAPVANLMEGMMGTMFLTKFKALAAVLVVGCAVAITATAGWRANAAGSGGQPSRSGNQSTGNETPRRAASNSDKERIAELERERDQLLKQLAELRDRLAKIETQQRAAEDMQLKVAQAARDAAVKAQAELKARDDFAAAAKLAHVRDVELKAKLAAEAEELKAREAELRAKVANTLAADEKRLAEKLLAQEDAKGQTDPARKTPGSPGQPDKVTRDAKNPSGPAPTRAQPETLPSRPGGGSTFGPKLPTQPATTEAILRVYAVSGLVEDEKEGEALVKVVRATVEPKSWGGDAGVEYLPGRKVLVIRQSPQAHKEIKELLNLLQKETGQGSRRTPDKK